MDRLKQIETFVAVATKGSLTAAAQGEGVAPAIIGRRMDALEVLDLNQKILNVLLNGNLCFDSWSWKFK